MSEPPPKKSKADKKVEEGSTLPNEDQNSPFAENRERNGVQPFAAALGGDAVNSNQHPIVPAIGVSEPNEADTNDNSEMETADTRLSFEDICYLLELGDFDDGIQYQDQDQEEEAASNSQQSSNGVFDDRSKNPGLSQPGLPVGVSDSLLALSPRPVNGTAIVASRYPPIAPRPNNSSGVGTGPVNRPAKTDKQTRGDGTGNKCWVCGEKKKDCEKRHEVAGKSRRRRNRRRCLLPLSGPGFFEVKTDSRPHYFRRLEDVLAERNITQRTGETAGENDCPICKQRKRSEYHQKHCLVRPGVRKRLAEDGKTWMLGYPITLKAGDIHDLPPELESVRDVVQEEFRARQLVEGSAEDHEMTSEAVRSQDDEDDGDKKPAAVDKKSKRQGKK